MNDDPLKGLQDKIDAAQEKLNPFKETDSSNRADSMNRGMQILTEMIGIMVASGMLGYFLDYLFGTTPALLLSFLVLGMITFFYKLIKMTKNFK